MFEFLFSQSPQTWQKGEFFFASGWSLWALAICIILVTGLSASGLYRYRSAIKKSHLGIAWILQSLVASLILLMLWQPSLRVNEVFDSENRLSILLDVSASMSYGQNDTSRLQNALIALQKGPLASLQKTFKTTIYAASEDLQPLESLQELPAPGMQSNLGESLIESLELAAREPLAAVILVSDGSDNGAIAANPDWWNKLVQYDVPIHTVGIGRVKLPEDLELLDVELASSSLAGSVESAMLTLRHGRGGSATLKVYDGNSLIVKQELKLSGSSDESSHSLELPSLEPGVHELRFALEPWLGELNLKNNQQKRLLHVAEQQRRVLYVEGEPRWEYKFIRRALHNNPGIRLVSLLRTSPNKFYRQGIDSNDELIDGFPTDRESLYAYDAIVIGSFEAAQLDKHQHDNLRDFVASRGGSLLMLAGSEGLADGGWGRTSVASALPVRLPDQIKPTFSRTKVKVELSESGHRSPITKLSNNDEKNRQLWREMPEIGNYQSSGEPKPGSHTLLEFEFDGRKYPLLVQQRYGLGYSYVLATAGTWRWQMQLPSDDQRHETFWRQLLWSMVDSTPARIEVNTQNYIHADRSIKSASINLKNARFEPLPNAEVTISIDGPGGLSKTSTLKSDPDQPGVYLADFNADETGVYRIAATAIDINGEKLAENGWVLQEGNVAENFSQQQNKRWLERVAMETGGEYLSLNALENLPDLVRSKNAGIIREHSLPLWNMPFFFLAILLLKATEWLLRLRWGRI